jgi:integrase/recombinase XerD
MKPSIEVVFKQDYEAHLKHLRLKGLQPKTIDAYARGIRRVGDYFGYDIRNLSEAQLLDYFVDLLDSHSWSAAKLDLYGLKFFHQHVLGRPLPYLNLVKPPKAKRLPDIVTVEEAQLIFQITRKASYRVFFFVLYTLGLRLSEGIHLKVADIDGTRMRVHIRDSKGNKDRLVPLPQVTLDILRRFWALHRNPEWLFPSRAGGLRSSSTASRPLDRGGVQTTLRRVCDEIGIKKRSPRTAFATATPPI